MQEPKCPKKPNPPKSVVKWLKQDRTYYTYIHNTMNMAEIKKMLEKEAGIPLKIEDIVINYEHDQDDYCGILTASTTVKLPDIINPNYEKDFNKYQVKMEKYLEKLQNYELDLQEYKRLLEEYKEYKSDIEVRKAIKILKKKGVKTI